MRIRSVIKGFTLIELLVVITIIGILATWATTVYTSQIQKARDSTRVTDIWVLQQSIEQVYQDNTEYPYSNEFLTWAVGKTTVSAYMEKIPGDPKNGQTCNAKNGATDCWYTYAPSVDANGIAFWAYEISTAFENEWNVTKKAALDNGNDTTRLEIGTRLWVINTSAGPASIKKGTKHGACTLLWWLVTGTSVIININGTPATPSSWCN